MPILPPSKETIARAVACLRAGGLIGLPTETVYGLAADARNAQAIARVYEVKGRPRFNPLILHIADRAMLDALCIADPVAERLMRAFWPGPLTLVLPCRSNSPVAELARAGLPTLAVRRPAHPVAQAVIAACGFALAAPSANPSGGLSPTTATHVETGLGHQLEVILDGGPCAWGLESSIVAVTEGRVHLLRSGSVPAEALAAAAGQPVLPADPDKGIQSPGQLARHYAPGASLRLNAQAPLPGELMIGFGPVTGDLNLSVAGDLREAAAISSLCWHKRMP